MARPQNRLEVTLFRRRWILLLCPLLLIIAVNFMARGSFVFVAPSPTLRNAIASPRDQKRDDIVEAVGTLTDTSASQASVSGVRSEVVEASLRASAPIARDGASDRDSIACSPWDRYHIGTWTRTENITNGNGGGSGSDSGSDSVNHSDFPWTWHVTGARCEIRKFDLTTFCDGLKRRNVNLTVVGDSLMQEVFHHGLKLFSREPLRTGAGGGGAAAGAGAGAASGGDAATGDDQASVHRYRGRVSEIRKPSPTRMEAEICQEFHSITETSTIDTTVATASSQAAPQAASQAARANSSGQAVFLKHIWTRGLSVTDEDVEEERRNHPRGLGSATCDTVCISAQGFIGETDIVVVSAAAHMHLIAPDFGQHTATAANRNGAGSESSGDATTRNSRGVSADGRMLQWYAARMRRVAQWFARHRPRATVLFRTQTPGHFDCATATATASASASAPAQSIVDVLSLPDFGVSGGRSGFAGWHRFVDFNAVASEIFTSEGHLVLDTAALQQHIWHLHKGTGGGSGSGSGSGSDGTVIEKVDCLHNRYNGDYTPAEINYDLLSTFLDADTL